MAKTDDGRRHPREPRTGVPRFPESIALVASSRNAWPRRPLFAMELAFALRFVALKSMCPIWCPVCPYLCPIPLSIHVTR